MIHYEANVANIFSHNGIKTMISDPYEGSQIEYSSSMTLYAAKHYRFALL